MDANFRRTVQQKIKNMGDKKVFTSPEFQEYASLLVHAVSKKPKSKLNITLSFDKKSDITAYTDGQKIFANLGHSLVQTYKTAGARFLAAMGMLFHECAHIRFYNNQEYTALIKKALPSLWLLVVFSAIIFELPLSLFSKQSAPQ